jgi:hypothetical protein
MPRKLNNASAVLTRGSLMFAGSDDVRLLRAVRLRFIVEPEDPSKRGMSVQLPVVDEPDRDRYLDHHWLIAGPWAVMSSSGVGGMGPQTESRYASMSASLPLSVSLAPSNPDMLTCCIFGGGLSM